MSHASEARPPRAACPRSARFPHARRLRARSARRAYDSLLCGPWGAGCRRIASEEHTGRTTAFTPHALHAPYARRSAFIHWLKSNHLTATAFHFICDMVGNALPADAHVDASLLQRDIDADVILLGRFYRNSGDNLAEPRDRYLPGAVLLDSHLGIGKHLDENIHTIIDHAERIILRGAGVLEKWSFSYRSELAYILSKPALIERSEVILEDGTLVPLVRWAGERGLLDRVVPTKWS